MYLWVPALLARLTPLEARNWKPKLHPMKEQPVVLPGELFLQPLNCIFSNFYINIYFNYWWMVVDINIAK